jgi:deoxyadenosine/deoxycytidine kinase
MNKIALCGAHSTGKTTLGKDLAERLNLHFITNTMRNLWQEFGVSSFEKLPQDARALFQKYALNKQIELENDHSDIGFITDRSVIDFLCYTQLSSNMNDVDLQLYTNLISQRAIAYAHFIYFPIMFDGVEENLRANLDSREKFDQLAVANIQKLVPEQNLLILKTQKHEDRMTEVLKFIHSQ